MIYPNKKSSHPFCLAAVGGLLLRLSEYPSPNFATSLNVVGHPLCLA